MAASPLLGALVPVLVATAVAVRRPLELRPGELHALQVSLSRFPCLSPSRICEPELSLQFAVRDQEVAP